MEYRIKEYKGELYRLTVGECSSCPFYEKDCTEAPEECLDWDDAIWEKVPQDIPLPNDLKHCPSCNFTLEEFQRHKDFMESPPAIEEVHIKDYWPRIVEDPMFGPMAECQNCDFVAWWPLFDREEIPELWNKLERTSCGNNM